jgi:hypothetical protein
MNLAGFTFKFIEIVYIIHPPAVWQVMLNTIYVTGILIMVHATIAAFAICKFN